jgi:repressor of nif and glnA expression
LRAGSVANVRELLRQRGDQISQKALRVTIQQIERKPANRHFDVMREIDEERGLAITRRCREQQQLVIQQ